VHGWNFYFKKGNSKTCISALSRRTFVPLSKKAFYSLNGAVAQSVEQRTENPCVGGSIPSRTTLFSSPHFLSFIPSNQCWAL
jgi:hypothetical protein